MQKAIGQTLVHDNGKYVDLGLLDEAVAVAVIVDPGEVGLDVPPDRLG